ncbi:hypothetical protein KC333_g6027 [Hortaea werneckii]|uniref:HIG1 domain-containing protein n=1 Tax=Hortaea werneckii TaxID=91943 RepID=A0A3M6XUT8_HORWE|nr:hypothetical protein KC342_g8553 [Hortaea werneckii]KAI7006677.1 hypothetical protein KC355_g7645 [Hortaea werneckii]KAI7103243.1 hypothetical protein KC339_g5415 [Hortaea werneckii]KAI7154943.1 hypothetical protein KC349_g7313 [Hortaea werneckii]KAI7190692.1 hypothetical protein KC324_g5932 [Hortaea werneckii]
MKILTPEEEQQHYNETVKGGTIGGVAGLTACALGVWGATKRYPAFRSLTLPMKSFLITSGGTFAAIVSADSYSRGYEARRNPQKQFQDESQTLQQQLDSQKGTYQRTMEWLNKNRYSVVFGSWVASMTAAFGIVGRSPYLSTQQKLVQARVYAQGLTLAVVIISLAFETTDSATGNSRWSTVRVADPNAPGQTIEKKIHHEKYAGEDQWRDMVEAEEQRMKEREDAIRHREEQEKQKKGKKAAHLHPEKHTLENAERGNPEESKEAGVKAP